MKQGLKFIAIPAFLIMAGCNNSYNVTVLYDDVEGLENGAKVLVHGLQVGEVESMDLTFDAVAVTLEIEERYKIPVGSEFYIESPGMLGGKQVSVEYAKEKQYIKEGDTVKGAVLPQDTSFVKGLDSIVTNLARVFNEKANDTIAKTDN